MSEGVEARVADIVRTVIEALGLTLEVAVSSDAGGVKVELEGESGNVLLRRRGEALDALQHIVNTAVRRDLPDKQHVVIDCLGFRRDRDEELKQMAQFLMDRVKMTGAAQEMGPLNPYARRIVHLTVAADPALASESVGDAFLKTVIISARHVS